MNEGQITAVLGWLMKKKNKNEIEYKVILYTNQYRE